MKVSIIGLGKLGLPMAAIHAYKGYETIGLDVSEWLVNEIKVGRCPIYEPGLEELMARMNHRLQVTTSYDEAVSSSDVSFIIVPTPSGEDGKFSNDYVLSAIRGIAPVLKEKKGYHLIVVTSTVMPGTMENVVKPEIEKLSGKKCGKDFGLCYSPEFIALGNVIDGMLNPDAVLIGESDDEAGLMLEGIYKKVCANNPPIRRMSWWNAEVAKLMLNVYVTTKISLANTYAEVCERIPDGDVDDVTGFLGLDKRIGARFFKGGLGFGGPCFPRDGRAFIAFAKGLGVDCPIQQAVDGFNESHGFNIARRAMGLLQYPFNKTVSVLGLTYKPNTNVVEESASLEMVKILCNAKLKVKVFDPAGMDNAKHEVYELEEVENAKDIVDCLIGSDLCVFATPWDMFKALKAGVFVKNMRKPVVLDCWRVLDGERLGREGVEYHAVGVNR
jgi:UDPglucose 6-dehydrogenase